MFHVEHFCAISSIFHLAKITIPYSLGCDQQMQNKAKVIATDSEGIGLLN